MHADDFLLRVHLEVLDNEMSLLANVIDVVYAMKSRTHFIRTFLCYVPLTCHSCLNCRCKLVCIM